MVDRRHPVLCLSLPALIGAGVLASAADACAFPGARSQPGELRRLVPIQAPAPSPAGARDRMPFVELNAALEEARSKLEELTGAAEIAALAAALREELEQLGQENRRLGAELEKADRARVAAVEKLAAAEERLGEAEAALGRSDEATKGLRAQLAATQQELAGITADLAKAAREREEAQATADALRGKAEGLQRELISARGEVERLDAENGTMEAEIAQLRDGADSAAAAARQNLLAVEDKIRTLNGVLAEVMQGAAPAAGKRRVAPAVGDTQGPPATRRRPAADASTRTASFGLASAAAATAEPGTGMPLPPATSAQLVRQQLARVDAPVRAGQAAAGAPLETARGPIPTRRSTLAELAADLPLEARVQVENLLADLKAAPHRQGLVLTVPGGDLFASDGDEIGESAHEPLAKAAELISIYGDRQVLIMGHTDAMGDAGYNKVLSERRADLVKQFFVDHFEIEPWRLATAGVGEERPVASNATRAGRQANRRVEVLIMD